MKEPLSERPLLAEELLRGRPGPHYLTGDVLVDANLLGLRARALFPSTDSTIGDRGHVNVAHYLFGVWNAAHILAVLNGFRTTLSKSGVWSAHRVARPDTPMDLRVEITDADIREKVAGGIINAAYSIGDIKYGEFSSNFFARR